MLIIGVHTLPSGGPGSNGSTSQHFSFLQPLRYCIFAIQFFWLKCMITVPRDEEWEYGTIVVEMKIL